LCNKSGIYNINVDLTKYINKDKIKALLEQLKDKEQELSDEQGYWR